MIGLEFDKGQRDTTEADYQEFWALVGPHIGIYGCSQMGNTKISRLAGRV